MSVLSNLARRARVEKSHEIYKFVYVLISAQFQMAMQPTGEISLYEEKCDTFHQSSGSNGRSASSFRLLGSSVLSHLKCTLLDWDLRPIPGRWLKMSLLTVRWWLTDYVNVTCSLADFLPDLSLPAAPQPALWHSFLIHKVTAKVHSLLFCYIWFAFFVLNITAFTIIHSYGQRL